MKKGIKFACIIGAILVVIVAVGMIVSYALGIEANASGEDTKAEPQNAQVQKSDLKTPLEWAKIEIASDERYDGKEIMWAVMPIEWHELDYNEAMYIIIAMTEDYDLVLDYYGVQLNWKVDAEKVSRAQVKVDADLFKTEIIGDDGVILDYDNGKIIGDDGEVVIGGNSQTLGEGE